MDYYLAVNNNEDFNKYITKISKNTYKTIKNKSTEKAKTIISILSNLQTRYKIFKPHILNKIKHPDLVSVDKIARHFPLFTPLAKSIVTSEYGMRKHPLKRKTRMHNGIDIAGPKKSIVYSSGQGIVEKAEFSKSYGHFILINHRYKFKTRYAHLAKILVKKGDVVMPAQSIGIQGNSGYAKKEHLHFEVIHEDKTLNPWNFIKYDYQHCSAKAKK